MAKKLIKKKTAPPANERYSGGTYMKHSPYMPGYYFSDSKQDWPVLMPDLFLWKADREGVNAEQVKGNDGIYEDSRIVLATAPSVYKDGQVDSIIVETPRHLPGVAVDSRVSSNTGINANDWQAMVKRWEEAKKAAERSNK